MNKKSRLGCGRMLVQALCEPKLRLGKIRRATGPRLVPICVLTYPIFGGEISHQGAWLPEDIIEMRALTQMTFEILFDMTSLTVGTNGDSMLMIALNKWGIKRRHDCFCLLKERKRERERKRDIKNE